MSQVNLPVITLRKGPWQADVFDPRPQPALLGARYVHGGYVARLLRDGRELTGATSPYWYAYDGSGLPETFESGLAWHLVAQDEEYLRPGAGRLLKKADEPGENQASGPPLTATLDWTVESGADFATFRSGDQLRRRFPYRIGYRIERTIRLRDDGLDSTTTFTLDAPFARQTPLPMTWYAHPFFRQNPGKIGATSFRLPSGAQPQADLPANAPPQAAAPVLGPDGRWAFATAMGGRLGFTMPWGAKPEAITAYLDPSLGGGQLSVALDKPYDHLVLWANDHAASVEPKLAKTWLHGETQTWTVSYRWQD